MEDRAMRVFMKEIVRQGSAAAMSAELFNDVIDDETLEVSDLLATAFFAAQGMLTAGAQISKILWMSGSRPRPGCSCPRDPAAEERAQRAKHRCKALRDALGVKAQPPELNRRVRNAFEHFDEKLDTFFAEGGNVYADLILGGRNTVVVSGAPARYVRRIDPKSLELFVLDDSIALQDLLNEIDALYARAQEWLDEHD